MLSMLWMIVRIWFSGTVPSDGRVIKIDGIVAPGFLDLQVNGGGGVLFNDDPSPQAIDHIRDTHARYGTIGILPTVITDAPDVIDRAADAVIEHGQRIMSWAYILRDHIFRRDVGARILRN